MRYVDFRDMFIEYKLGRKGLNSLPLGKLPVHRIVFFAFVLVWAFITLIVGIMCEWELTISMIIFAIAFEGTRLLDNTAKNLRHMGILYRKYDIKRIKLILKVLKNAQIDFEDVDTIKLLIGQANEIKQKNCFAVLLVKYRSCFAALAMLVCELYGKKVFDNNIEMENIFLTLLLFGLYGIGMYFVFEAMIYVCAVIVEPDFNAYDDFIHDLSQVILFKNKCKELSKDITNIEIFES